MGKTLEKQPLPLFVYTLLNFASYYDWSVLPMSVMGFHTKKVVIWGWVGGWVSSINFILDLNFAKPLTPGGQRTPVFDLLRANRQPRDFGTSETSCDCMIAEWYAVPRWSSLRPVLIIPVAARQSHIRTPIRSRSGSLHDALWLIDCHRLQHFPLLPMGHIDLIWLS